MPRMTRRAVMAGAGAVAMATLPAVSRAQTRLIMNDASRLNPTPVARHWHVRNAEADLVAALRRELKMAEDEGRPVCVGAARHSMGGQALVRDGVAMTLDINQTELDKAGKQFRAAGGTRWHEVIATLDPQGFSPAVMQSNSDFGIAATFSVNAHGWPTPYGPFGATVRAFRIMLADGTILRCSREENSELFGLAMGGYGAFGIILDLDVEMVENMLLRPKFEAMPAGDFAPRFIAAANDPAVPMIYGRLNVERGSFFEEALLVTYRREPVPAAGLPPVTRESALSGFSRRVYRAQVEREWGKSLRWFMEKTAGPALSSGISTRNSLMNEPVLNLANRDYRRTDILHEYFVAPDQFGAFIEGCRRIIPKASTEFLNVTLRHVKRDANSLLSYATTDRIAAVMSFSQKNNPNGETDMIATTEALIDMVGSLGGSYYLPYRLHARPNQFLSIYPGARLFAARKRQIDPKLLFRNTFWDAYLDRL